MAVNARSAPRNAGAVHRDGEEGRGRSAGPWLIIAALFALLATGTGFAEEAVRPALLDIFRQAQTLADAEVVDGIPDFSAPAIGKRKQALAALRTRFEKLDPAAWTPRDQVDYLLVRAELDKLEYSLYVYRAASRSPNFYLSSISSFGMSSGATLSRLGRLVQKPPPFGRERAREIIEHMDNTPRILAQARRNLTEPTVEMSRWALPTLADAQENSKVFAAALAPHFPDDLVDDLHAAADAMGDALADYRAWIERRLPDMARAAPVGRELYDWLLQRVWLLPYDAEDILRLGEQEYARYLAFTEFEESRNRGLPWPEPLPTTEAYVRATAADEEAIRRFLADRRVLTIPDWVDDYRRTEMPGYIQAFPLWAGLSGYSTPDGVAVKYAVPTGHPYTQTYWESIMRIDPSTNIFHDGVPGHHFQGLVSSRHPSPIRSARRDRFKSEGWCTYWEEAAVQLGFYEDRPRSRELIYNFLRLRALRVIVDAKMALGEMSREEGIRALMRVPMDERIATEEIDDFFAAPTGGIVYQIGKLQIEHLLGERRAGLGERFDLGDFHDRLVHAGWVPLELTRFEMTGRDEHVRRMLEDRRPMPLPPDRGAP